MKTTKRIPITLAATTALLVGLIPTALFAAPVDDGSGIPVAQGEVQARSCYLRAEQLWNKTMASSPRDHQQLDASYRTFAGCAKIAVDTGHVLRSGQRVPWMPEYFADTVGATYAQLQLATITKDPEHCTHLTLAQTLAEQASETEGEMSTPGSPDFEKMWSALRQNVKMQSAGCGKGAAS